ncbi:MAG: hypothetical protein WDN69_27150 [Aliidongia sp.]
MQERSAYAEAIIAEYKASREHLNAVQSGDWKMASDALQRLEQARIRRQEAYGSRDRMFHPDGL